MNSWKCQSCGYEMKADLPPNDCPSCKKTCEFLDITCYTPDCKYVEVDHRIGAKKEFE